MRLKFLFFPIILIISLAIFIGYIWPEITSILEINDYNVEKSAELQSIKEKQAAIELINKKISENVEEENAVKGYLPENKIEERIISGINYLAGGANVPLLNISLIDSKETANLMNSGTSSSPGAPVATNPLVIDPITGKITSDDNKNLIQNTSVKIAIAGDYEKIKIFLDSLQRMPIFNTVKSVNITKEKNAGTDPAVDVSLSLSADIIVDFGYLSVAKVNSQQLENFKPELDNDTILALNKYISQKSQSTVISDDRKGKLNPFAY